MTGAAMWIGSTARGGRHGGRPSICGNSRVPPILEGRAPSRPPKGQPQCGGWARALSALASILVLLCSCAKPPDSRAAKPAGLRKEFERGPVKVVLAVDRSEITLAERVRLTLEVLADEDCETSLPAVGDKLEQFGIVDYTTLQPELVGDKKVRTGRTYVLEPFLSGDYVIPAMKIPFTRKGDAAGQPHEVETEEMRITVKSLLPENLAELKIHDVSDPVTLPRPRAPVMWAAGVLAGLAVAAAAILILRRRRRRGAAMVQRIPADELALRELEKLVAEDLTTRGEIKPFYQRISNILRTYIENRFQLRAPEQTTEEFLAGIGSSKEFPHQFRSLLDTFLNHCDLVKFAELQPATADIQQTFDSCKSFITGTKEAPQPALKKLEY